MTLFEFFTWPFTQGYADIQRGDWIGFIGIGIIMVLLPIGFVALIAALIYEWIDTSGPTQTAMGTVTEKRYVPAHTTMVYNAATKTNTPIFHPARWYAAFATRGVGEEIQIEENIYDALQKGDRMNVVITMGRLSKRIRILDLAA